MMMNQQEAFAAALWSEGPASDAGDPMLFGQFVGEWDFDWTGFKADGSPWTVKGEWIFAWALNGRVIQDVWICPSRSERRKPGSPQGEYGSTLRFYDPKIDAWQIVWIGPANHRVRNLIAKPVGAEIVLEDTCREDGLSRWIFSQITPDSFHWRSVTSKNEGKTWLLKEEMSVRRRSQ